MTSADLPSWLPRDRDVEALRAGVHWDAVRVPATLAADVLERLGDRTGAVIEDRWSGTVCWLVPAGTADTWNGPHSIALGAACWVTVPGPRADTGHRWLRSITTHSVLTGPRLLAEALDAVHVEEPAR